MTFVFHFLATPSCPLLTRWHPDFLERICFSSVVSSLDGAVNQGAQGGDITEAQPRKLAVPGLGLSEQRGSRTETGVSVRFCRESSKASLGHPLWYTE